jgi:hypothetical protein
LHELVSHVVEILHGHGLVASGHDQQDLQYVVRIPDQINQVLPARTVASACIAARWREN